MVFKVNDIITVKKDGHRAVVTNAYLNKANEQKRVEVKRLDNGSVFECWADEVARV